MNSGGRFILIPAHNRRALTLGCLASLRATGDFFNFTVIVVDDGSTDGTSEAIHAEHPATVVLRGDGSLFWTGAIALAMREASARGGGPLVWLNDDCRPRPGALPALLAQIEANSRSLAAPRCIDAATGTPVPTGFIGRDVFSVAPGATREVEGLSGFCVGIGATAAAELPLPEPEKFPHYYGDTAYTLRASRAGCPITLVGDAVIDLLDHQGGPADLAARVQRDESLAANARRIFTATNSPYRWRTLYAAQALKYGPLLGPAFATTRLLGWGARLIRVKLYGAAVPAHARAAD